jgi:hypothetical protein
MDALEAHEAMMDEFDINNDEDGCIDAKISGAHRRKRGQSNFSIVFK